MPATSRDRKTFRDTLEAAHIDPRSLELRADGTVGPPAADDDAADLAALLPQLGLAPGGGDVQLGERIGEGGMGVVRAARQTSLGRTVAVKVLQDDARTAKRVRDFVREARVTGLLEHPNVVPIHGLAAGDDGSPWMIMKRVVGQSWLERIEQTFGAPDHLAPHLEVLRAVCRAVEAAHAQGILHRDIKPDNVLVGDFGEVLVVDWGLAIAFGDPPFDDMPRVTETTLVVGTPRYMAPEMAVGDGRALGPATDVYLLGATLHHVLTGDSRHQGEHLMELLYEAYASEPFAYDAAVPEELARIANRACAPLPEERFEDVAAFRRALEEYERHAGSIQLAAQARARLDAGDEADLTACRFGFEQALAMWSDNPVAEAGLVDTLEREATRALDQDAFDQARGLIARLEEVHAAVPSTRPQGAGERSLRERLAELSARMERRQARVAELERTAHEQDLGVGIEGRRAYGVAFGLMFGLYNVGAGLASELGVWAPSHLGYVVGAFLVAATVGLVALTRLPRLTPNRAARRLLIGLAVILSAQVPVFLALGAFDVDIERSLAVSLLQLGGSFTIKTLTVDERMIWVGALTALLGGLGLLVPALSWYLVGLAYAAFFIGGAFLRFEPTEP